MKTATRLTTSDNKLRALRSKVNHCWSQSMRVKELKMQTRWIKERSKAVDELMKAQWELTNNIRRNILAPNLVR